MSQVAPKGPATLDDSTKLDMYIIDSVSTPVYDWSFIHLFRPNNDHVKPDHPVVGKLFKRPRL